MSGKSLTLILLCMSMTWITWSLQAPMMHLAQRSLGPWKTLACLGTGWAVTSILIAVIALGLTRPADAGQAAELQRAPVVWGLAAGAASCVGALGIALAFRVAGTFGNHHASAWISPSITAVLPVFYLLATILLLPKPSGGYRVFLAPGYLLGAALAIAGAALMMANRPR